MRKTSAKCGRTRRQKGEKNSRRFAVCCEHNSPLVFSKETAERKKKMFFNYCAIRKGSFFACGQTGGERAPPPFV